MRSLRLTLGMTFLFASTAHAEPGPIGSDFPAGGLPIRSIYATYWCTDGQGVTTTLSFDCNEDDCPCPTNILAQNSDSDGKPLGDPFQVNIEPAGCGFARIDCSSNGNFVVETRKN